VIALLNTLAQLSTSVKSVQEWRRRERDSALFVLARNAALALAAPWLLAAWSRRRRRCPSAAKA
jgi:hypothetical protein